MDDFSASYDLMGLSTKSTGGKISKVRFDNTKQEFESNEVLFATGSWDSPKVLFLNMLICYHFRHKNVYLCIFTRFTGKYIAIMECRTKFFWFERATKPNVFSIWQDNSQG